MKNKKLWLLVVSFLFGLILYDSPAQLRLFVRSVVDSEPYSTDPWQYPTIKARIRAERSGIPVQLTQDNVLILENNRVSKPFFVGPLEQDSSMNEQWQLIKWITQREGMNTPIQGYSYMIDTIIAFHNNDIAKVRTWHYRDDLSFVRMNDPASNPIVEFEFKDGGIGSSQNKNVIVKALAGMKDGTGEEGQIWIDSVAVDNENFRYKWDGWSQDKRPPPLHIWPGMPYFMRLYYEPKNMNYHTGKLTVYYDHGLKSEIMLIGHEFHIPTVSNNLKLLYPTGTESFTPCQEVDIEWEGYIRGMATYIDFSSNGGVTWDNVGISDSSFFTWNVPNVATKSGLIRVRQSFKSSYPVELHIDESPVYRLDFNYDGSRLLSTHGSGIITSWNTTAEEEDKRYFLDSPNYPVTRYIQTGVSYIKSDSIFAVTYFKPTDYPQRDSIALFHVRDDYPFMRAALQMGFKSQKVEFDSELEYMALIPNLSTIVKIHSVETGDFVKDLNFESPVSAFSFSKDTNLAAVALWSGKVMILTVPEFNIVNEMDYSDFPLIISLNLAPNGNYLALGCKSSQKTHFTDKRTDVFIVNLPTNQVVRRMRKIISDPIALEFSPQSTKLLIGIERDRQITYWDLPVDEVFNNFVDHDGTLTDFAFSPYGSMIATSAKNSSNNLYLRRFTYAESDENRQFFEIITPSLSFADIDIPDHYLAQSEDYHIDNALCVDDTSLVDLKIDSISIKYGEYFKLIGPRIIDTVLFAGECLPLSFNFKPLDVGNMEDAILIHSCGREIEIPLNSNGLARNIQFIVDEIEFDPTCLGIMLTKEFPIAINADPVQLIINEMEIVKLNYTPFLCLNNRDVIYEPGDTIYAKIRFEPYATILGENDLIISHSDQLKYQEQIVVKGLGKGSEYDISHNDLRFIPEILTREIEIYNKSIEDIYIDEVIFEPPHFYELVTNLPLDIKSKDRDIIEVRWLKQNGIPPPVVNINILAGPCAASKDVSLGLYQANSLLEIPDIFADPRGNTTIKINYINDANYPYNGHRFFEGEFILNPRFFLPESVSSPYGEGEIIRNEIINDRRIVGFRVEGDLPEEGTAAEIHGLAGLAETDTTHINLLPGPVYWGESVNTTLDYAVFQLINICNDRLVTQNSPVTELIVNPNPSTGLVNIIFNSEIAGSYDIELYNTLGTKEKFMVIKELRTGKNSIKLDLNQFKSGIYNIVLKNSQFIETVKVIVIR